MADLHLNLKGRWFDEIKEGVKQFEYRKDNEYWQRRLLGRDYDRVIVKRGYPKKGDMSKTMIFKWRGFQRTAIRHPEFGNDWVHVFAIDLRGHP